MLVRGMHSASHHGTRSDAAAVRRLTVNASVRCRAAWVLAMLLMTAAIPQPLLGYSALTHEAIVDSAWTDSIKPLLLKKYAGATDDELQEAHAYAYGGCIIQDMGYYPFGSAFFTDLLHYVRSGDFAAALINDAEPINEYAFALGALEHYIADQTGHALATNEAVPLQFPELQRKYDSWVTYEDDPVAHLRVEFGFDVLEVASGRYTPELNHNLIGFQVATQLLERTFYKIYGLKVSDVLANESLAIGTYRHTVSEIIPEATKIAWDMKNDAIQRALPGIRREQFVYSVSREAYEQEWGNQYERPSWFDKVLAFTLRLIPKYGPISILSVKPPTPETERLFELSFAASVARYRAVLRSLPRERLTLEDLNLDTGEPARAGAYKLADNTYAELVHRLQGHYFADADPELRDAILAFYDSAHVPTTTENPEAWRTLEAALAQLRASPPVSLAARKSAGESSAPTASQ